MIIFNQHHPFKTITVDNGKRNSNLSNPPLSQQRLEARIQPKHKQAIEPDFYYGTLQEDRHSNSIPKLAGSRTKNSISLKASTEMKNAGIGGKSSSLLTRQKFE